MAGGEKIAPSEIDEVLARHPEVEQASAFGVPAPSPDQIRAFAARSLSFPKVPKRVILVHELPYNDIGKVKRAELTKHFGIKSDSSAGRCHAPDDGSMKEDPHRSNQPDCHHPIGQLIERNCQLKSS